MMTLTERLDVLCRLGDHLLAEEDEYLHALMHRTYHQNKWFTVENQKSAVKAIAKEFLDREKLNSWAGKYDLRDEEKPLDVGMVMAGNIPLAGFHDLLCAFVAGHRSMIKLSQKDQFLLPYLLKLLSNFDPRSEAYFQLTDKLKDFDAVIATGSNNTARYFEAYFGKYPHIIRKNRNSVAVLDGTETDGEILALGKDIFLYFGLGCRNVSKIYVPEGYPLDPFLEVLHEYRTVINHKKYHNNFEYNMALAVLNKMEYKSNGCLILLEDSSLQSRIATLHYQTYADPESMERDIRDRQGHIQCIVARESSFPGNTVLFGRAQEPGLSDYADGIDTLQFLIDLGNG